MWTNAPASCEDQGYGCVLVIFHAPRVHSLRSFQDLLAWLLEEHASRLLREVNISPVRDVCTAPAPLPRALSGIVQDHGR